MAKAKPIQGLKCDADARDGARLVLLARAGEMAEQRAKALDFSDPEGVHAMRVTSRRLRSALRDFRSILPKRDIEILGKETKAIADALGAVRDEDVAIIALEKFKHAAPPESHAGFDALIVERVERREPARFRLAAAITDEHLAELLNVFSERLAPDRSIDASTNTHDDDSSHAAQNFRGLGRGRIRKQFDRLNRDAASLYRPMASRAHHDLRIESKRLRYALELFAVCWRGRLTPFANQISDLQGALGDLHDCDVWLSDLETKLTALHDAALMRTVTDGEADELLRARRRDLRAACDWLLDHLAKERTKHYRRALAIWTAWETDGFADRLAETLNYTARPRARSTKSAAKSAAKSARADSVASDAKSSSETPSSEAPSSDTSITA